MEVYTFDEERAFLSTEDLIEDLKRTGIIPGSYSEWRIIPHPKDDTISFSWRIFYQLETVSVVEDEVLAQYRAESGRLEALKRISPDVEELIYAADIPGENIVDVLDENGFPVPYRYAIPRMKELVEGRPFRKHIGSGRRFKIKRLKIVMKEESR